MVGDRSGWWESLEKHSSTLFLGAGVLFVFAAANNAVVFSAPEYDPSTVSGPLLLVGLLAALLGMMGTYPRLREPVPRLARAGVVVASVTVLAVLVLLLWGIGTQLDVLPDLSDAVAIASLLLMILTFALFGVSVLRTDVVDRAVGVLLLAEAVALVAVFAIPVLVVQGEPSDSWTVGIEAVQALLLLGVGYVLRRDGSGIEHAESAPDTAA